MKKCLQILIVLLSLPITQHSLSQDKMIIRDTLKPELFFVENGNTGIGYSINKITVNGQITNDQTYSSLVLVNLKELDLTIGDSIRIEIEHEIGTTPKVISPAYRSATIEYIQDTSYLLFSKSKVDQHYLNRLNILRKDKNINHTNEKNETNGKWIITNKNYSNYQLLTVETRKKKLSEEIQNAIAKGYEYDTYTVNEAEFNPDTDTITTYISEHFQKIMVRQVSKDYTLQFSMPLYSLYKRTKHIEDTIIYASGNFKNSKKEGIWEHYYPSGKIKSKMNYQNGDLKGIYQKFSEDGSLLELGSYNRYKYEGEFIQFYPNRNIKKRLIFNHKGYPEGIVKTYYPNEYVKNICFYEGAQKNGISIDLNEDGEITQVKYYINGEIKDTTFDDSTQIHALKEYADIDNQNADTKDQLIEEEKEVESLAAKNKQQSIVLYFTIAILIAIIFFVYMIWKTLKSVREQKELVSEAKLEIEEKNQELVDSITYAKRIQSAILPPDKLVKEYLKNSFVLYKPKDIVAGDFYWMEPVDSKILFAAADCTGHGVPGAMVSVLCNGAMNRSVREFGNTDPGKILDKAREIVIKEFEKSEEEVKDGMDIALCSLEGRNLKYSGAHNPLWIIHKDSNEIEEIKANKQPIGKFYKPEPYKTHTITLNDGDTFFIFSDGFSDQFGGEKGKKFKAANFKKLLLSIQKEDMQKQRELIDTAFEKWRGNLEQLDDVCVIGVRV
jgi:serine phosphatase RsbU (regulator of sigma subunit)/antitoxin component YwqK of YwqJK toxin-antitoxin module